VEKWEMKEQTSRKFKHKSNTTHQIWDVFSFLYN